MNYVELDFELDPLIPSRDIIIALLSEIDYESFSEFKHGVKAYIPANLFDHEALDEALASCELTFKYKQSEIEHRNWNEKWEREYEPVIIDERCIVRAPFHAPRNEFQYQLIIQPQMSFGTGHHPTTILMLKLLLDFDLEDKTVLDLGTGTGVLSILAEKKGAASIYATDVEDHVVVNAKENLRHNDCVEIRVDNADMRQKAEGSYDLILANINLNTLLAGFQNLASSAKGDANMMLSGFYEEDAHRLIDEAKAYGFQQLDIRTQQRWAALHFHRSGFS